LSITPFRRGRQSGVVWRGIKEIGRIFKPPDIKGYLKNISADWRGLF